MIGPSQEVQPFDWLWTALFLTWAPPPPVKEAGLGPYLLVMKCPAQGKSGCAMRKLDLLLVYVFLY